MCVCNICASVIYFILFYLFIYLFILSLSVSLCYPPFSGSAQSPHVERSYKESGGGRKRSGERSVGEDEGEGGGLRIGLGVKYDQGRRGLEKGYKRTCVCLSVEGGVAILVQMGL